MQLGSRQGLHERGYAPTHRWAGHDLRYGGFIGMLVCTSHDWQLGAFQGLHEGRPCLICTDGQGTTCGIVPPSTLSSSLTRVHNQWWLI
eukprot:11211568-Lingulodinium_polyedra.AAC.1